MSNPKRGEWSSRAAEGRRQPILPTPVRIRADSAFTGRGVTVAFLDSGFYPHPDLVRPRNRVRAYHNVLRPDAGAAELDREFRQATVDDWHGMMTSVVAAGNGFLSGGAYRGVASEADVVLVKVGSASRIVHDDIRKGLDWVVEKRQEYGIRVVNISCGGDYNRSYLVDPLCRAAEDTVRSGLVVVAAAGNLGNAPGHPVIPPANCPALITVGGLDDKNRLDWRGVEMYRSSYGPTIDGLQKPELISPAIWLAAPILPGTTVAAQAQLLIRLEEAADSEIPGILERNRGIDPELDACRDRTAYEIRRVVERLIEENKVISPHYKHVDGTSFAAPILSSIAAQMLEANPDLTPQDVKLVLMNTARRLRRVPVEKQGWGVVQARTAVREALGRKRR